MSAKERVVITGVGVVSPIGVTRESFWSACLAGRTNARRIESPWVSETGLSTRIASAVADFRPADAGIEDRDARLMDRTSHFVLAAAREAVLDAGFEIELLGEGRRVRKRLAGVDPTRVATVIGSGIGGLHSLEVAHSKWVQERSREGVKRYSLPMLIPNAPAGQTALRFGAQGECSAVSTACAAGTMAIGSAFRILERGEADVVICGAAEGVAQDYDYYALMGFDRLKTMSTRNDAPEKASRPFDRERDGFVLGEGSAVLVLEREAHAEARGKKPYVAVASYTANCDALSMMQPDESGDRVEALWRSALAAADLSPDDVDLIHAHGTSTILNDRVEAKATHRVFGARAGEVPITALKSMTGHAISASGPMEVAAASLGMVRGVITPTINYEHPDPECDVDVVANTPREAEVRVCLKPSYGFGGHNACLILVAV